MKNIGRALICVVLGLSTSSCAILHAGRSVEPLEIPEPPPRASIEPAEKAPMPSQPVAATARPPAPVASTAPTSPPPATASSQPSTAQPAAPPPSAPPPAPAPGASPELRPSGSGAQTISPAEVREMMERTAKKLDALDPRKLSAGKRSDYDAARRFLSQAHEAVKANNLMAAQYSADKAETLADGLR